MHEVRLKESRDSFQLIKKFILAHNEARGFFSVVSDGCTKKRHHYTSIGVSWVDENMELHNFGIGLLQQKHGGLNVEDQIRETLDRYGIPTNRLLTSTTDTAAPVLFYIAKLLVSIWALLNHISL